MKNTPPLQIAFDCYKVKSPHTGLHTFCKELSTALDKEARQRGDKICFYLPRKAFKYISSSLIKRVERWYHAVCMRLPDEVSIWHQPYQLGKIFPCNATRVVLTLHDLNFLHEKEGKRKAAGLRRVQRNIHRATHLVAISHFVKREVMAHLDTQGKPFDVIYNGYSPYGGEIIPPRTLPTSPFLLGIGTILPKKNWHVLPPLLVGNNYQLIIAGNGSSEYASLISQEAERWGVAERVTLTGPISEGEKEWYLSHCEAFVFPSLAEGFGLPVIEAMAHGKRLFLSPHTALPEIGGKVARYFDQAFSPKEMQSLFEDEMSQPDTQEAIAARKARAAHFSWETAAHHYWNIYTQITSTP